MFENIEEAFNKNESATGDKNIYSKAMFYLYGHNDSIHFKDCYELELEKGTIDKEIENMIPIVKGKAKMLFTNYIFCLIERKDDYRKGWKIFRLFSRLLENDIENIYKNNLNGLIKNDLYSIKIKKIVREINNAKQQSKTFK